MVFGGSYIPNPCVSHFALCTCSAQLSMFHTVMMMMMMMMMIIIIIIIINIVVVVVIIIVIIIIIVVVVIIIIIVVVVAVVVVMRGSSKARRQPSSGIFSDHSGFQLSFTGHWFLFRNKLNINAIWTLSKVKAELSLGDMKPN